MIFHMVLNGDLVINLTLTKRVMVFMEISSFEILMKPTKQVITMQVLLFFYLLMTSFLNTSTIINLLLLLKIQQFHELQSKNSP